MAAPGSGTKEVVVPLSSPVRTAAFFPEARESAPASGRQLGKEAVDATLTGHSTGPCGRRTGRPRSGPVRHRAAHG